MTKPCPTLGPTCRGCPDCQGIPPGAGIYNTNAEAETDGARRFLGGPEFQSAATDLMIYACGSDHTDFRERLARFVEEAMEAGYDGGLSAADLHAIADHVTRKPPVSSRDAFQAELGQAFFTLACLASWAGFGLEAAGRAALRLMDTPERIARFRRKRAKRHGRGALPGRDPLESA